MSPIKVPSNLPELVKVAFGKARINGDLTFFPTQVTILTPNSIPFQLRFSPALANKPAAPRPKTDAPLKHFDPFENPAPPLLVTEITPGYNIVLNKFAVVPEHFLLCTKEFKEQTHLLEEEDLAATYACIDAYRKYGAEHDDGDGELYAYFNSGAHSGASQPHRHIQFLPVARMRDGLEDDPQGSKWTVLADKLGGQDAQQLPFATFSQPITPTISAAELHGIYLTLYRQACVAVENHSGLASEEGTSDDEALRGEARISYNLAMTANTIVVSPRLAEGSTITADGELVGKLALNGTVLAGTALVKSEAEWDALRQSGDGLGLVDVLAKIGVPTDISHEKKP